LGDSTIGIKVADGTYYPVLEHGFTGRKKLVLTTARDNQSRVQIDLYRGNGSALSQARYIGSLIIENIPAAAQGQPEIELFIGIDVEGQLSAEANDMSTGVSQRFATSLTTFPESQAADDAEFVLEGEMPDSFEEPSATSDEEAESEAEPEPVVEHRRRGPNLLLLILFVILGVLLVAAVAYFVYRSIQGPAVPALPSAAQTTAAQPAPTPAAPAAQPSPEKQPAAEAKPAAAPAASYLIKRGDTLWDLASTYYRNPWLYPRLAKANGIRNPDLIFAGTRITIPAN
jgi:hypothetical protein